MDLDKCKVSLDVYDVCAILSTVGFVVVDEERSKHKRTCGRNIEITCNMSGKKIFLESSNVDCYCWRHAVQNDSEKWEMSGTSGGVQTSKIESSITSWKDLPKSALMFIEKNVESLVEIVRGTNYKANSLIDHKNSSAFSFVDAKLNKIKADCNLSLEDVPMNTSKSSLQINKMDDRENLNPNEGASNNMYRSLDTLTAMAVDPVLPQPGVLTGQKKVSGIVRQNTYSIEANEPQEPFPTRTSSPVPSKTKSTMKKLVKAEKLSAELSSIIQEAMKLMDDENSYPALSPYCEMDFSKISQNKVTGENSALSANATTKSSVPYASSPNISMKLESKIPNTTNLKRAKSTSSYRVSVSPKSNTLQKAGSLKRSLPKKLITIPTPSFVSGRKSIGSTAAGSQLPGMYKSIRERVSLGAAAKDSEVRRISYCGHIKPAIQRYSSVTKK